MREIGNICSRLTQTAIKQEPNAGPERAVGIPGGSPSDSTLLPSWGVPSAFPNTYQQLSAKLVNFLQPLGGPASPTTDSLLTLVFQPDNVREFLANYTHFHTHFSILHIPTFRVMDAHPALLAGMCTIGACYSERVTPASVRRVIGLFDAALEASSRIYNAVLQDPRSTKYEYQSFGNDKADTEELQAIMLDQVLLTWHNPPPQRLRARSVFPRIASFVRKIGLLHVSHNPTLFSPIHQPDFSSQTFDASSFDWSSWVEQEKRIRIMYFVFLSDVCLGLYFNTGPEFDVFEVHLPLPSDDAAWDASSASECAEALGLHGPQLAKIRNPDGTQRCNQPELDLVLRALLDSSYQMQPGATNLYGKFILIHAILGMMRRVQLNGSAVLSTRSHTPLPQNTWFVGAQGGGDFANMNGRATPILVDAGLIDRPTVKMFATALEKFKANWDHDMASQFPPTMPVHPRRYGFSRDGIHFYWLANYILKNTRAADLQMPPDQRFVHVMHMLKSVKNWVLSDSASRGEELGSVGEIEAGYAVDSLTLDMTELFRPSSRTANSPAGATAQAGANGNGHSGMV